MKQVKRFCLAANILFFGVTANAQEWVDLFQSDTANFYTIRDAFNTYWSGKTVTKGKGYKQFKRWEWFTAPRVYPTGERYEADKVFNEFKRYREDYGTRSTNGNWTSLGPNTVPTSGGGAGRINCVRFHPTNTNIVFAGSPAGGLWKSTDGGNNWALLNTDDLQSLGVYDVAIHPTNPNIIYIATGDVDGGDTYSIGVLKSTDGGLTWNPTGLTYSTSSTRYISRLLIHPTDPDKLLAATNVGVMRTTDGGVSWNSTLTGTFRDMEFKPGNPDVVYVCGTIFKYSTDGGVTWNNTLTSLTSMNRMSIAVTPANPNYVYLLASNGGDNGFHALLRSSDSGVSFSTRSDRSSAPNILGWDASGWDTGGQGWYDLAVAASPTNANQIFTGGVNVWESSDGGSSWDLSAHWYGGGGVDYVHADIHDIQFVPGSGSNLYVGCDGGVFKSTTTGASWSDKSDDLEIGQMYRLGVSQTNASRVITGWQDNGTNLYNGPGTWDRVLGGDGMECMISHSSASVMYGSLYYGNIHKSTNAGVSWTQIVNDGGTGVNETGPWITPYEMWEGNANHIYVGKSQLFKSTNAGSSFTQVGTIPSGGFLDAIAIAPSNSNYIYVTRSNQIFVTTNANTTATWTARTAGLPVSSASITDVAVSNTDPNKAWVTFSGFAAGQKVYMTTDAGVTWTNITYGLPNIPTNCIVYQNGSSDGVYIGMDIGVYYIDNTLTDWVLFNTNLPNTIIDELEIQYSSGKLRAATYGRSLWESDLFSLPTTAPIAAFNADVLTTCAGIPIQFFDVSTNIPTSWLWTFGTGATPSTSTDENPVVVFNTPGTYDVTLQATNGFGSGTSTYTGYITIMPEIMNNTISSDQLFCGISVADTIVGAIPTGGYGFYSYNWMRSFSSPSSGFLNLVTATNSFVTPGTISQDWWYKRIVSSGMCKDTSNIVFLDFYTFASPVITQTGATLSTPDLGYSYQWYLDGVAISGATDTSIVVSDAGIYTVVATDSTSCTSTSSGYNFLGVDEDSELIFSLYPNPANELIYFTSTESGIFEIELINSMGQQLAERTVLPQQTVQFSVKNLPGGVYFVRGSTNNKHFSKKVLVVK